MTGSDIRYLQPTISQQQAIINVNSITAYSGNGRRRREPVDRKQAESLYTGLLTPGQA